MMKRFLFILIAFLVLIVVVFSLARKPMAQKLNEQGLLNFSNSEYEFAEKKFIKALFWHNNFHQARRNLIKSQLGLSKTELAKENLNLLAMKLPIDAETYALRGQIQTIEKQFEEAIPNLNSAIESDSLLSYAYFYRGIAKANLGDLEGAAIDYLKAQELNQSDLAALQEGAFLFGKLEDFEAAISSYNRIIELDPKNTNAYLKRGNFKMEIGDHQGAVEDFTQTIKLDPEIAEANFNRGKSFGQLSKYEEAILDFVSAKKSGYKPQKSDFNAGLASLQIRKLTEAEKFLKASIKNGTENEHASNALYLLGIIKMMQQNNSESIAYFDRSIALDKSNQDALYNRGIAHGILKNYELAIADLNSCIELGNNSADIYFALGVNTISLNNFEKGCSFLSKASEMGHEQAGKMQIQYCKNISK